MCALVLVGGCSALSGSDDSPGEQTGTSEEAVYGMKDPGPRPGAPAAGAPRTKQPIAPDDAASQQQSSVACYPGLAAATLLACAQAVIRFQEVDSVTGSVGTQIGVGLGPVFNGNSCAMCHAQPAVLGSSPGPTSPQDPEPNPQIALATLDGADNDLPEFITEDGPVREVRFPSDDAVHDLFTVRGRIDAPGCDAMQPDFSGASSFRIPTPLFGLGLVENTPDAELRRNLASSAWQYGTGGAFNVSSDDGTIQRFGWKAQVKSIQLFASQAYIVEQGVTTEGFPNERGDGASDLPGCLAYNPTPEDHVELDASGANTVSDVSSDVENFALAIRLSKPAAPATPPITIGGAIITSKDVQRGAQLFASVGCASCHTPSLTTVQSSFDPAMSKVTYHPYSDFAIHHVGPRLADGITQGLAGPDEFRTAPLWGVGQRLFFLHDGRTKDLGVAILAHGGEASRVISNFRALDQFGRQEIIYFLRSL